VQIGAFLPVPWDRLRFLDNVFELKFRYQYYTPQKNLGAPNPRASVASDIPTSITDPRRPQRVVSLGLDAWLDTIESRHVHMVFAGHDHHYERTCPIRAGACVPGVKQGTLYVTSAGAGASLYDSSPQWFTAFSKRTHHYVLVTLSGRRGTSQTFDIDGNRIDSHDLSLD